MNILLWILQVLLGLYYLMGGFYMMNAGKLPKAWLKVMPKPAWMAVGALQALLALGMLMPMSAAYSAMSVALLTLLVSAITGKFARAKDYVWVIVPAIVCAFIAYGRLQLAPF